MQQVVRLHSVRRVRAINNLIHTVADLQAIFEAAPWEITLEEMSLLLIRDLLVSCCTIGVSPFPGGVRWLFGWGVNLCSMIAVARIRLCVLFAFGWTGSSCFFWCSCHASSAHARCGEEYGAAVFMLPCSFFGSGLHADWLKETPAASCLRADWLNETSARSLAAFFAGACVCVCVCVCCDDVQVPAFRASTTSMEQDRVAFGIQVYEHVVPRASSQEPAFCLPPKLTMMCGCKV